MNFYAIICVETGDEYVMQAVTPFLAFKNFLKYIGGSLANIKLVGNGNALAAEVNDKTYYCDMR